MKLLKKTKTNKKPQPNKTKLLSRKKSFKKAGEPLSFKSLISNNGLNLSRSDEGGEWWNSYAAAGAYLCLMPVFFPVLA